MEERIDGSQGSGRVADAFTTAAGDPAGLSADLAARRLAESGPNALPPPPRVPAWRRLVHQLVHFFAILLWVAAALALLAGMPELAVAITVVVLLNAAFAFAQEHRADKAAQRLRSLLPMQVSVRRDGRRIVVDATGIVVGDVVLLEAGDRVPADATLLVAHDLTMDTSLLTGESIAARAEAAEPVFAGTFVLEGEAEAMVTATGAHTRLAEIARLTTATPAPPSPLAIELNRLVRAVAAIALGIGSAFFVVALLIGDPLADGFILAVGVTVALVPEALLPTVTLALAWGAEQMADKQVLVRHLDAVESLGSTTFICTDKTGTLTQNQMTVVEAWTTAGGATSADAGYDPRGRVEVPDPSARPLLEAMAAKAVLCSTGGIAEHDGHWRPTGDPMEAALDVFARRLGIDTDALREGHHGWYALSLRHPSATDVGVHRDRGPRQGRSRRRPPALHGPGRRRAGRRRSHRPRSAHSGDRRSSPRSTHARHGRRSRTQSDAVRTRGAAGPSPSRCRTGARGMPDGRPQGRDDHGRPPGHGRGDRDRRRAPRPRRSGPRRRRPPGRRRDPRGNHRP